MERRNAEREKTSDRELLKDEKKSAGEEIHFKRARRSHDSQNAVMSAMVATAGRAAKNELPWRSSDGCHS